eukprot:Amastigsp_a676366_8.p2 type:complete len:220 gc:universal Amastigsp_a676366_8:1203-544(-)
MGTVTTHEMRIRLIVSKLMAPAFEFGTRVMPVMAPTMVCESETGIPSPVAMSTTLETASCAENPRAGVSTVIREPIVAMTLWPRAMMPDAIPAPPRTRTHSGTPECTGSSMPYSAISRITRKHPTPLPMSFEPWANETSTAVAMRSGTNSASALAAAALEPFVFVTPCGPRVSRSSARSSSLASGDIAMAGLLIVRLWSSATTATPTTAETTTAVPSES